MTTTKNALAVCMVMIIWLASADMHEHDSTKVIVREGHRVVVVEYDQNGHHNTKVSISPPENTHIADPAVAGFRGRSEDDVSVSDSETPKDSFYVQAKEAAKDRARRRVTDIAKDVADDAKEAVKDSAFKVKEAVKEKVDDAKEGLKQKAESTNLGVMNYIMMMMGLLGYAIALGTSVWVSFVSSNVLGRAMGRQQFGLVQSKVYPAYFKVVACGIAAALLGLLYGHVRRLSVPGEMYQAYNLSASLLIVLANLFLIEPRATKVMFESMKIQKEEGKGVGESHTRTTTTRAVESRTGTSPVITSTASRAAIQTSLREAGEDDIGRGRLEEVNRKLKMYNSSSSLLNMVTLAGLMWHLVYLSQLLHNCSHPSDA